MTDIDSNAGRQPSDVAGDLDVASGATRDERAGAFPWRWVAALTTLAAVLRIIGLNDGLWYDEIITLVLSVRLPLSDIVTAFPGNNQHTLVAVIAHICIEVFGEHNWTLRLAPAIAGVATVPVLFWFARQFCGKTEALLACALLTASYHHVWFSQNARGYAALALLAVLSSGLLLRLLRDGRMADARWYAVAAALGVYTHLTMVFLVISHAVLCLVAGVAGGRQGVVAGRWRPLAWSFAMAGGLTLLLYSPVLLDVKQFFVDRATVATVATPAWAAAELVRGLRIGLGTGAGALAAGLLLMAGLWSYLRQSPFLVGLFLLPGVLTTAAAVALQRPIFPRFLFFSIGFALLIVVRGALELGRRFGGRHQSVAGPVLIGAMIVASLVSLIPNYRYPKQDFAGAMQFIDASRAGAEPVVMVGLAADVYRDYYQRDWVQVEALDDLERVHGAGAQVWVVYTLEGYIWSKVPDLMQALRDTCVPKRVFRGTLGNGDITVCAIPPGDPARP